MEEDQEEEEEQEEKGQKEEGREEQQWCRCDGVTLPEAKSCRSRGKPTNQPLCFRRKNKRKKEKKP